MTHVYARLVFTEGDHLDFPLEKKEIKKFEESLRKGESYWPKNSEHGYWFDPKTIRVVHYQPTKPVEEEIESPKNMKKVTKKTASAKKKKK